MKNIPHVILKPGRDASVKRRHPWLFSGGIARIDGQPSPGELVAVYSADRQFVAWGHYSPKSQIRVRLIAWDRSPQPDTPEFWQERLQRAIKTRAMLENREGLNAYRLVHAESDGIPGLVVDHYGDNLVVQYLAMGTEVRRELFADLLQELINPTAIYERSDADVRKKEGLSPRIELLRGTEPPDKIDIQEDGLHFLVDIRSGHKSGFYLDQRPNRALVRKYAAAWAKLSTQPSLLNVFSYTGGFAVYGLAGDAAHVVNIDSSAEVLKLGQENLERNGYRSDQVEDITGDAFQVLRDLRETGRTFDMIVVDPPKFAFSQRDVQKATRGYKDINMQALHLLNPGGILFTFSCSGAISADLFQKVLFGAALDTGRDTQIMGQMAQGSDHPVALTFPEGAYLKGLICRVI